LACIIPRLRFGLCKAVQFVLAGIVTDPYRPSAATRTVRLPGRPARVKIL